jgi:hypothetical protein
MRERLDFCSVSKILFENMKEDGLLNREFYSILFSYAFTQTNSIIVEPDDTIISRTLNGERNVVKDIVEVYHNQENVLHLQKGVTKVLEYIVDRGYVEEQLNNLLWNDKTISLTKKKELLGKKDSLEQFVTHCLVFGMTRKFISKEAQQSERPKRVDLSDFLLNYHMPLTNKVFLGRKDQLMDIHQCLSEESCLFLTGIGGIGKSELAKQYAKRYKKEYHHMIYLSYTESLHRTICDLAFVEDSKNLTEDELFAMHYRFFEMLDESTLVILDNFNVFPDQDELFHKFIALSFRLLVTTRNIIDEVPCYAVKELAIDDLAELFYSYAPQSETKPQIVHEIIEEIHRHTLTVEMAAKTLTAACLAPEKLLSVLKTEGIQLSNPNRVKITKDSRTKRDLMYSHIKTLFRLQDLSKEYRYRLCHMLLVPEQGISKVLFQRWLGLSDYNATNELIEVGWIREDIRNCRISIHPFLWEVLIGFIPPSFKQCEEFIEKLGNEYVVEVEDEIDYRDLLQLSKSVLQSAVVDDTFLAFRLFEKILSYLNKYNYFNTMDDILNMMKQMLPLDDQHRTEMAAYDFYQGIIAWNRGEVKPADALFKKAIANLEPLNEENAKLGISVYNQYCMFNLLNGNIEGYHTYAERAVKLREVYGFTDSIDYEFDKLNQELGSLAKTQMETGIEIAPDLESSLNKVLEIPEMKSFINKIREDGIPHWSRDEFRKDIEKIQPEESPNAEMGFLQQEIKEQLENMMPDDLEEVSFKNIFSTILSVSEECVKQYWENGKSEEK